MNQEPPKITEKLFKLEPGQPFYLGGEAYTRLNMYYQYPENRTKIHVRCNCLSGIRWISADTQVELILDKKEFREMESGQEFYDKHGLLHRRLNDDCGYIDESSGNYVNSLCYYDNELWGFGLHDPVFVVKK